MWLFNLFKQDLLVEPSDLFCNEAREELDGRRSISNLSTWCQADIEMQDREMFSAGLQWNVSATTGLQWFLQRCLIASNNPRTVVWVSRCFPLVCSCVIVFNFVCGQEKIKQAIELGSLLLYTNSHRQSLYETKLLTGDLFRWVRFYCTPCMHF